jgi:hypothetical protein
MADLWNSMVGEKWCLREEGRKRTYPASFQINEMEITHRTLVPNALWGLEGLNKTE